METPYFVIDEVQLDENIHQLKKALSERFPSHIMGYSFKTNALPWIITKMKAEGFYAEVVSEDEYALAKLLGYQPQEIIYNGPAKDEATFADAIQQGAIVNLETHRELEWLEKYGKKGMKIGLRLQIDIESLCPGESFMGEFGGRFGFQLSELPALLELLKRLDISLAGLHVHTSSKTRSLAIYQQLSAEVAKLIQQNDLAIEYVDIGGGFFGGRGMPEMPRSKQYIDVIYEELSVLPNIKELTLIVEPGASMVASPISFVTSVIDVKQTPRNFFVTTDGSRTNIDPFMGKSNYFFDISPKSAEDQKELPLQIITGFTCMEHDHLFQLNNHPQLKVGQQITYHKVGAYTMCFNPLFIRYFPDVYVKKGTIHEKVRKRWTAKEYIQNSEVYK